MRIALFIEGKNEGSNTPDMPQSASTLIKRMLAHKTLLKIELVPLNDSRLPRTHGKHTTANLPMLKKAISCLNFAKKENYDAAIILSDRDRNKEKQKGLEKAHEIASENLSSIPNAIGIPTETFDAWVLADIKALQSVTKKVINQPSLPETYTGKEDSSNHPKDVIKAILDSSEIDMGLSQFYEAYFSQVDIEEIAKRCPSFKTFKSRVDLL